MPEKPTSEVEAAFHSRRKAFVIFDAGILTAADGFAGSHFDLLVQTGMDGEQARRAIETCPRGYALNGDVFLYQGADFSALSERGRRLAERFIPFFKTNGWLAPAGKVYDWMRRGAAGSVWTPLKEF